MIGVVFMNAYVCLKCAFYTTIKNRYSKCPVCDNYFTEITNKESKIFLNLNGNQRIQWIENKIGHSIPEDLCKKREEYKFQKINEMKSINEAKQSTELNAKLAHGKAILEEQSRVSKCPSCGSANISKIGTLNRMASIGLLGLASSKIGKTHKCNNCGTTW